MHIFFGTKKGKDLFSITNEELKHLRVRRVKVGEEVGVIWEDKIFRCRVRSIDFKEALCEINGVLKEDEFFINLTLIQSVPVELRTFDTVIRKATELGVTEIIPLITERSFQKINVLLHRYERFNKIIREAMKQSKRPYWLEIKKPMNIKDLRPLSELNLFFDNFSEGKYINEVNLKGIKNACVVVGPEGGFSRKEVNFLKEVGFIPVKLRTHVLKTETAAILGAGIILNLASP